MPDGLSQLPGTLSLRPVRPVRKPSESAFNSADMSTSPAPVASYNSIIFGLFSLVTCFILIGFNLRFFSFCLVSGSGLLVGQ